MMKIIKKINNSNKKIFCFWLAYFIKGIAINHHQLRNDLFY